MLAGCGTAIITAAYTSHWGPKQPPPPILESEDVARRCATMAVEMLNETIEKEVVKRQNGPTLSTAATGAMPGTTKSKSFQVGWNPNSGVWEAIMDGALYHCTHVAGLLCRFLLWNRASSGILANKIRQIITIASVVKWEKTS